MKKGNLLFLIALLPVISAQLKGQPHVIKIPIRFYEAVADTTYLIQWGVHPDATDDIDSLLGEPQLPPAPPAGGADLRFQDPPGHPLPGHVGLEDGTSLDLRHFSTTTQSDTYKVVFQPGLGGYPITLHWPKNQVDDSYNCAVRLVDVSGGLVINVDMKTNDSLVITSPTISTLYLIAGCPIGLNIISGKVFDDLNGDGIRDAGEPGLVGWKVRLGGDLVDTVETDATGYYEFDDLLDGTYNVSEVQQLIWQQTSPVGNLYSMTVQHGQKASNRDFGNFYPVSFSGMKFNDDNGNNEKDLGELPLANWKIILGGARVETTLTDAQGLYSFAALGPGTYTVREKQESLWVMTAPGAPGYYTLQPMSGADFQGIDFGNKLANAFTGTPGSSWSDPNNWSMGHTPTASDAVVIHTSVVIDALPNASVLVMRIAEGGSISYQPSVTPLTIIGNLQIEIGGVLTFVTSPLSSSQSPSASDSTGLICYGDWINHGEFNPGHSTITFAGDRPKIIDAAQFWNLEISGLNTSTADNVIVNNMLFLHQTLYTRDQDTVFINNPAPDAIQDTGRIPRGTVKRTINGGELASYRFESPKTFLQFDGTGSYPSSMMITTSPAATPPSFGLDWEVVGGAVDENLNTITAESIGKFSKWSFGIPRPRFTANKSTVTLGTPKVSRTYAIRSQGGSGFHARVRLAYDQSELLPGSTESSLQLLRGPVAVDSVFDRWNIVSVPVTPEDEAKDVIFPTSTSNAFAYTGTYSTAASLGTGVGYWLKFSGDQLAAVLGDDRSKDTLIVTDGWNMIGVLSYPLSVTSARPISPTTLASEFFGYRSGYKIADSLMPMQGYWVKVHGNGKLVLSPLVSAPKRSPQAFHVEALNDLTIQDADGNEQKLYFGSDTKLDPSLFELPPPPPSGIFDARFETDRMVELANDKDQKEIQLQVRSARYPLTVRWNIREKNGHSSLIVGDRELPLIGVSFVVLSEPVWTLKLRLDPSTVTSLPKKYALEQNYPNPFNPTTVIRYQLPVESKVTVRIYNVLGQLVTTLVDGIQEAGFKSVEWNSNGIASGVYFYRMEAANAAERNASGVAIKKMLLIR